MIKHGLKYFKSIFVFVLCVFCFQIYCQETLQITFTRFGKLKKHEIYTRDILEYKLKGEKTYSRLKIATMRDSIIVFDNDSIIKISELKRIKIHNSNHLYKLFSKVFFIAGLGYLGLNVTNNIINNSLDNKKAIYISASLIVVGIVIKQLSIKRIYIDKRKTIKILDLKYDKLLTN